MLLVASRTMRRKDLAGIVRRSIMAAHTSIVGGALAEGSGLGLMTQLAALAEQRVRPRQRTGIGQRLPALFRERTPRDPQRS